jgi:nicotinamidase-related amidase
MSVAVLIVDAQVAFCDADGSMARQGRPFAAMAEAAVVCGRLAAAARAQGVPVIWTRMAYRPDYSDGGRLINDLRPNLKRMGALQQGSRDVEISSAAGLDPADIVIDKTRYSALIGTDLETLLRERGITRVIVGGVTTSMCVDTTVRDLSQRDYEVLVLREGCGDFDTDRHESALAAMEFGFAPVIGFDAALAALSGDVLVQAA